MSGEGDSSTSTMLIRCLFLVQFCAGLAAPLVATSSTVFDVSPVADRHAQVSTCVHADCPVLLSEQSRGSFVSMPATFFDDIIHDSVLIKTPTDVTSVVKDIKAPPQLHRFSGEGDSSTSTMLNRCLFLVQSEERALLWNGPRRVRQVSDYHAFTEVSLISPLPKTLTCACFSKTI
ncbi:hypothetical protein HPB51_029811 [Rhipicephalus microplus]|uniref:Secreted protein n=1 Tax=Rhipicephalus microplus TaxID=6941 RepID=A0A9J6CTA3_RHIMP|nr:hypothetical protein HPB51_029811 [Rhipicephalus microplus]